LHKENAESVYLCIPTQNGLAQGKLLLYTKWSNFRAKMEQLKA
jgi:hypothetical protein